MSNCKSFTLKATGVAAILLGIMVLTTTAYADGLKDFVLSQLDGKGTVSSVNTNSNRIVIDDVSYVVFRAKPLPNPTAPYDQNIVKIWILPADG